MLLGLVLLGLTAPAAAEVVELPLPGSDAWQPLTFRGIERWTDYTRESVDGVDSLHARSNCSASGLVLPLDGLDLRSTPVLSWRWRVDRGLDIRDERIKRGDDFAARVYVLFEADSNTSLLERLRGRFVKALYGRDTPGSALNFVWSSHLTPGTSWDNPFTSNTRMIALVRGTTAVWRDESVDVLERYLEHFDRPAPSVTGIAIMSDSDNSCQSGEAHFASFALRSRPVEEDRRGR